MAHTGPSSTKISRGFKNISPKVQSYGDFSEEYTGSEVIIALHNGQVVTGRIVEARRYWLKVALSDRTILYINKAWIVHISPRR